MSKLFLNLGCGSRFIETWTNVDFVSQNQFVIEHDLKKGILFNDHHFEVVYHSHVLEHFSKIEAEKFIHECYRVLKKNGIIRVVLPDLEMIVRLYIDKLEKVKKNPTPYNKANYDWSMLELYDQCVRKHSGGEMLSYWSKENIINEDWVVDRVGSEFLNFKKYNKAHRDTYSPNIISKKIKKITNNFNFRDIILKLITGKNNATELLRIGEFCTSGEIHQWMYDSYSLADLLKNVGFRQIKSVDAFTSNIPCWQQYQILDIEKGRIRKPDSFFIEAVK